MRARTLALAAVLALGGLAVPATAQAGDWNVRISYGDKHDRGHHRHGHARHHHRHVVRRPVVVTGHWRVEIHRVWVPGHFEHEIVPAVWQRRWDPVLCTYVEVLVRPRRVRRVWVKGYHKHVRRRVWVPAPEHPHC